MSFNQSYSSVPGWQSKRFSTIREKITMMWKILHSTCLFLLVLHTQQIETGILDGAINTLPDAVAYLLRYGYLQDINSVVNLLKLPSLDEINLLDPVGTVVGIALSKFQQLLGLPVTGRFDEATKHWMNSPRCGNKDVESTRQKRFAAGPFRWNRRTITYGVSEYSRYGFPRDVTDLEVQRAFDVWSNATDLRFHRVGPRTQRDIDIRFVVGRHGRDKREVFSGSGSGIVLAHAYRPSGQDPLAGDVHFNDEILWTSGEEQGTDFFMVAVHEIGHALGLSHSNDRDAIMFGMYQSRNYTLHEDDVMGIQTLYGGPGQPPPNQVSKPSLIPAIFSPAKQILSGAGGLLSPLLGRKK